MEDDVGQMGPDRFLLLDEDCDTKLGQSASSSYMNSCHDRVDDNEDSETVDQTIKRLITSFEKFEADHLQQPSPAPNMESTAASPAKDRSTPKAAGEEGGSNTVRDEAAEPQTPWSFPNNMQQGSSTTVLMAIPISYCSPESPEDHLDAAGSKNKKKKVPRRKRKEDKVDLQNDPAAAINIAAGSAGSTSTTAKNKKAETTRKRKNKQGVADADLVNGQVEVAAAGGSASTAKANKKGKGRPGRKRIYSIEALLDSTLEADNKGKTEADGDQPGNSSAATNFVMKDFYKIENPDWLPLDWYIMGRPRNNGKQVDTYYYQPGGRVFKSAVKVKRLLGLSNTKVTRINRKPKAAATAAADGAGSTSKNTAGAMVSNSSSTTE